MDNKTQSLNYREILKKDGFIAQLPVGTSMYPMLKQRRDTVVIRPISRPLKENDVLLYQRDDGVCVLHRLIKITKQGYIIRGDNCYYNEYNIEDRHIFGILEGFYKKDKYIDCQKNKGYRFYVFLNRRTYYIRLFFRKVHILLSKIKHIFFK